MSAFPQPGLRGFGTRFSPPSTCRHSRILWKELLPAQLIQRLHDWPGSRCAAAESPGKVSPAPSAPPPNDWNHIQQFKRQRHPVEIIEKKRTHAANFGGAAKARFIGLLMPLNCLLSVCDGLINGLRWSPAAPFRRCGKAPASLWPWTVHIEDGWKIQKSYENRRNR